MYPPQNTMLSHATTIFHARLSNLSDTCNLRKRGWDEWNQVSVWHSKSGVRCDPITTCRSPCACWKHFHLKFLSTIFLLDSTAVIFIMWPWFDNLNSITPHRSRKKSISCAIKIFFGRIYFYCVLESSIQMWKTIGLNTKNYVISIYVLTASRSFHSNRIIFDCLVE